MWDLGNTPGRHLALYVEDEPINVMLMQALFERRPQWELVVATTGEEARRLPADLMPSLLMLDLRLPDCHGTQLLPELRRRPGWHIPPAVAVTAEYGFEAAGTGFDEVWAKPLDLAAVLTRLDQLLVVAPTPKRGTPPMARHRGTMRALSPAY